MSSVYTQLSEQGWLIVQEFISCFTRLGCFFTELRKLLYYPIHICLEAKFCRNDTA